MKISRRFFVAGTAAVASLAKVKTALARFPHGSAAGQDQTIPFIAEVTMAAPDIIRVEVRDPVITKYPPSGPLGTADVGGYQATITRNNPFEGGVSWSANVISLTKKWLKFFEKQPTQYLNRPAAKTPGNWGTIGGRTVSQIYYRPFPYQQGIANPSRTLVTTSRHYIYLHLSGNLAQGSYTISNATAGLAGVPFVWNDLTTRCSSIRASQAGVRPGDIAKQAYLSTWIPGHANEGAIDFLNDYVGLTTFNVIDATSAVVWSSGTVSQRTTPSTTDQGLSKVLTASTKAPKVATSITTGTTTTISTSPVNHGFTNGDVKYFKGFGNPPSGHPLEMQSAAITVINATSFSVPINTTGSPWTPGNFLAGYDGLIFDTFQANLSQTFVFDMDFSAYTGAPAGTYRLQIPGLGVSDPFLIHDGAYYRVAQNAVAGCYHQCNGLALDGRFGYTRPAPFVDGVNGVTIKWSMLPGSWGSEAQFAAPPITSNLGGVPITSGVNAGEWLTSTRATGLYGAMMDAGDWDSFVFAHSLSIYHLIDFCYEKLPTAARMTSFNFPKSTTTLDPTLYAGSDFLPDAIHQALWHADFYRRTQDTSGTSGLDGRVASGLGYDQGITVFPTGDGSSGGGAPGTFEPSWLSIDQPFLYAADEPSNFAYSGLAAKIAIIFKAEAATATGLGQTQRAIDMNRIASAWQTSAVAAYTWAATIFADSGTGGVRDAYYKTFLGLDVRAGWSGATYASAMTSIRNTAGGNGQGGPRAFAAGALWRLTGTGTYRTIIEASVGFNGTYTDDGLWEYAYTFTFGGGDATFNTNQNTVLNGYQTGATNDFVNYEESVPKPSYRMLTFRNSDLRTSLDGTNGAPLAQVIRAHIGNRTQGNSSNTFMRCLQAAMPYYYGANPLGLSYSVGVGVRYPNVVCHRDSEAMGVAPPVGLTVYGANTLRYAPSFNFSLDNGSNWTVEYPQHTLNQVTDPPHECVPAYEYFYENSYIIPLDEFTFEECIAPRQSWAMFLHGWDNNTVT